MSLQIPSSVTFEQAIKLTQDLLEQVKTQKLAHQQLENSVKELVNSINGARGFFVVYLTDKYDLDDSSLQAIIWALKTSPTVVSELLTKNVAMSTAMAITHNRNNDPQMAQQSKIVQERTIDLIEQLQLLNLFEELDKLHQTLETNEGSYKSFLERWNYDSEQRQAIYEVISKINM